MPIDILMPALSPTMEEGKLAKWLKAEGDSVTAGDVIAEIETDKATMEVEAVDEGTLGKILVAEGTDNVKVNEKIAVLLADGEDASAIDAAASAPAVAPAPAAAEAPSAPAVASAPTPQAPAIDTPEDPEVPEGTAMKSSTVREALRDAMAEEMRRDPDVFIMGEEVAEYQGAYKITQGLLDEFSAKRVIDTPITTLYMSGGQMGAPIVFRGPNGAAARVGAQHSQDYAAWYAHVPGLKVIQPYSAADAKGLLKAAIRDPNPVIFLAKIERGGTDVTLVSWGIGMTYTMKAAEELAGMGISAEVINLRTIRPLDIETVLASVRKTGRIVTVEEAFPMCSVSSEIAFQVQEQAFDYLDAPILRVTGKDVPMPYAANLEKLALPSVPEVIDAVKAVTYTA
ncbi:pdhB [Symbiodinium microadriaticum]|nr:pdhB [Symbiodinium microadriaticum]